MGRRGRKRQLVVEDEYWALVLDGRGHGRGLSACRDRPQDRVPLARRAWWAAAAAAARSERGDRYLSLIERKRIATLRERGHGVREIARRVDRAPSTISRELRRNVAAHDHDRYDADLAHARARARRLRPRRGRLVDDVELRAVVQARLELEWSPEQIAAWLRDTYSGPAGLACLPRDDLPGPLPRRPTWAEQATHRQAAHRSTTAQATPPRR